MKAKWKTHVSFGQVGAITGNAALMYLRRIQKRKKRAAQLICAAKQEVLNVLLSWIS